MPAREPVTLVNGPRSGCGEPALEAVVTGVERAVVEVGMSSKTRGARSLPQPARRRATVVTTTPAITRRRRTSRRAVVGSEADGDEPGR
jgi:hypothetical protein